MADRIQIRGDVADDWAEVDPILADREIAYDKTNNEIRIGDGASHWSELAPIGVITDSTVEEAVLEYFEGHPLTATILEWGDDPSPVLVFENALV